MPGFGEEQDPVTIQGSPLWPHTFLNAPSWPATTSDHDPICFPMTKMVSQNGSPPSMTNTVADVE